MKKVLFLALFIAFFCFSCKNRRISVNQEITLEANTILHEDFLIEVFNSEISQYLKGYFENLALNETGYLNGDYTIYWGINTSNPHRTIIVHFEEGKGDFSLNLKDISEKNELTLNTQLVIGSRRYTLPAAHFTYLPLFDHPDTQYYAKDLTLIYSDAPLLIHQDKVNFKLKIVDLPTGKYRWYYQYRLNQRYEKIEGAIFTHQLNIKEFNIPLPAEEGELDLQIVLQHLDNTGDQYFFLPKFDLLIGKFSKDCVPIFNTQDFEKIAEDFNKNYCLFNDIDLRNVNFLPFSKNNTAFSGRLNGQGYTLKNWNFSDKNKNNIGIFEQLSDQAVIENLIIENFNLEGQNNVGTLAGISKGKIEGIHIKNVKIQGQDFVGGLAGKIEAGSLAFNQLEGLELHGNRWIGGLSGSATTSQAREFYAQVVSATIHAQNEAGLFFGELNAGVVKFSYALGELNTVNISKNLLFGNPVFNIRQVYGFGEKNQEKNLIYWDNSGNIFENSSVYQMKTNIAQWQDYFVTVPEIQGQKPIPSNFNYYKIFKPSTVKHPKTTQEFPALFWLPSLIYQYEASKHDCMLKNVNFSFSTSKNATVFSFPKTNFWSNLGFSDQIDFVVINENFNWKDLTFINADIKIESGQKAYLHSDLPVCSGIWDSYPIFLHHLTLNLSVEQKGQISQTIYTDEPLWKNEDLVLPKVTKNQIVEGILESSAYPIILHYKEGNGVVPFEKKIEKKENIFWFENQNLSLPKQLEKIQWKNFIIPVIWNYKSGTTTLIDWQVQQNGQIFKAEIQNNQINLEIFPLTTKNAVLNLLENGQLYQYKKSKNNIEKLTLNEEIFLSDQDEIWAVSEDETQVKKYPLHLTLRSSVLGLNLEKASQNGVILKTRTRNQNFEIQKVNGRILNTQGVDIDFTLMEIGTQKVFVNNQQINVTNGNFTVKNVKNIQDANPTKIRVEQDTENAEYVFEFTYQSNQAKLLNLTNKQNQRFLNSDILNKTIIVYGINPAIDLYLTYYQYTNDGNDVCNVENCIEKNVEKKLNLLGDFLEIEAEDGTIFKYDFLFKYQYLFPQKTELRLEDLLVKNLFQVQFPPNVTELEVKIELENQLFWTKKIQSSQIDYMFTDFFEEKNLYPLNQGNFTLKILDLKTKEILDSQDFNYDFTTIKKNEDFQALNIHKHAQVRLENNLNAARTCFQIEDFLGKINGDGYQIDQLNCTQSINQPKKNYAVFTYENETKGKMHIKNLIFNDFYIGLTKSDTEVAGFLFAKIPEGVEVEAENLQFFQGILSVIFTEPSTLKTMPFGVFAGETLGKTKLNKVVFWDILLLGKTSYNALAIGKAENLQAEKIIVQGQVSYKNDMEKIPQKYIGGLVGRAENSLFEEIYTLVSFNFAIHYAYQTHRLGAFLGESKNNSFNQTYSVNNTYYDALQYNSTHFLTFLENPSTISLSWNGQIFFDTHLILPFGFNENNVEIQQNQRTKIHKNADLCHVGLNWQSITLTLFDTDLLGTQTQVCFPVWDREIPLYNRRADNSKTLFYLSKDLLKIPVFK